MRWKHVVCEEPPSIRRDSVPLDCPARQVIAGPKVSAIIRHPASLRSLARSFAEQHMEPTSNLRGRGGIRMSAFRPAIKKTS
jgi:hypothetical protein